MSSPRDEIKIWKWHPFLNPVFREYLAYKQLSVSTVTYKINILIKTNSESVPTFSFFSPTPRPGSEFITLWTAFVRWIIINCRHWAWHSDLIRRLALLNTNSHRRFCWLLHRQRAWREGLIWIRVVHSNSEIQNMLSTTILFFKKDVHMCLIL